MFGVYGMQMSAGQQSSLVINDLELAKRILIKDFDHFTDRTDLGNTNPVENECDRIFRQTFILQKGDSWKSQRRIMTPVFTTGKLKLMFPLLVKTAEQMEAYVEQVENTEVDVKEIFFKYALDGIGTAGFGIECNSFQKPTNTFIKTIKELQRTPDSKAGSKWEIFKLMLALQAFPFLKKLFDIPNFPRGAFLFLRDMILKTLQMRDESKLRRDDIIDLVLDNLKHNSSKEKGGEFEDEFEKNAALEESETSETSLEMDRSEILVANAFLFFVAGLDTTSSTMTFLVHNLLHNPEVQEKIYQELVEVLGESNEITFEHVQSMKYLNNVIYETLRLHHPFSQVLERECTKDYLIPGTDYVVRRGEIVNFTFLYERMKQKEGNNSFYNPTVFDPDNFSKDPDLFSFLAFGQGPRNCIGKRYAMIAMKLGLAHIMRRFRFVKTDNTSDRLRLFKFLAGASVKCALEPRSVNVGG